MNKQELEQNIIKIHDFYKKQSKELFDLQKWVSVSWEEQVFLDEMIDFIWIKEKNKDSRFAVYSRFVDLREEKLINYLKNNNFNEEDIRIFLDKAYLFVSKNYHKKIEEQIKYIEENNLLTKFYLNIIKWVHRVWLAMTNFHIVWDKYLIQWINKKLEQRFWNSEKIISYLRENDLFDVWHFWEEADRSYSVLKEKWDWFKVLTYYQAFKKEIDNIVIELDNFINSLDNIEDEIYDAKKSYIKYLNTIKEAFLETNRHNLVKKWSLVDKAWMDIKTPFQIWHPLEFYEDTYRKAVAVEWDLRLKDDSIMQSKVAWDIKNMYEKLFDEFGREKYKNAYKHSLDNQNRVQLYICSPVMYYASSYNWLFSAQVVPNDEEISKMYWKKIFANASHILDFKRNTPLTKIKTEVFDLELLKKYKKYINSDDSIFYSIYDIETIGHEYGHTLWLDMDTEVVMNKKTWNYKNIEEFKATTGWLVAYFMKDTYQNREEFLMEHVMRSIWVIARQEVEEVSPYYCECMIHLKILFDTKVIYLNYLWKIEIDFSIEAFERLKNEYLKHYKKLINIYLEKRDAGDFLFYYVKKEWNIFLPKDEFVRNFVIDYYEKNKVFWSQIIEEL